MPIRHTVIFTFYDTTTEEQIAQAISLLNDMGDYCQKELGATNWVVSKHIPESFKPGRAHLLQDCIFPNLESLKLHANSLPHQKVVALTPKICDWMTVDTVTDSSN